MNEAPNGRELRDLIRRVQHLEEHGSRHVAILAERHQALRDEVRNLGRELREDVADCRSQANEGQTRIWKELDAIKGTLSKGAWLLLSIPASLVTAIILFWIQSQ